MRVLHFTLQPRAPVGTPFRGDTLIGHLLWQYAYDQGTDALNDDFFERFKEDPPACSDLFPVGYLPLPVWPLNFEPEENRKELKRCRLLPVDKIKKLQAGLDGQRLLEAIREEIETAKAKTATLKTSESATRLHAVIDRRSGTTSEEVGGLYATPVTYYGKVLEDQNSGNLTISDDPVLHGYLVPGVFGNHAQKLLQRVGEFGYGADASSGQGVFEVTFDEQELFVPDQPDAWMALSRHLPDPEAKTTQAYYGVETHYGRLGGSFASSGNVFKHPLLLFTTGSLWSGWQARPRGNMLDHMVSRSDLNIRQAGYTIPLAFHLEEPIR